MIEQEEKKTDCPKCGKESKEVTTKEITLLDFGGGPVPQVLIKDRKIICGNCDRQNIGGGGGDVTERYQDDD
jgi:hypothetical protein